MARGATKQGLVLLRFFRADVPLYLVVEGYFHDGVDIIEDGDGHDYYYHTSTCPLNYMGVHGPGHGIKAIAYDGDADFHGVFRLVRGVSYDWIMRNRSCKIEDIWPPNNSKGDPLHEIFPELLVSQPGVAELDEQHRIGSPTPIDVVGATHELAEAESLKLTPRQLPGDYRIVYTLYVNEEAIGTMHVHSVDHDKRYELIIRSGDRRIIIDVTEDMECWDVDDVVKKAVVGIKELHALNKG